jgi:hypothetical protein
MQHHQFPEVLTVRLPPGFMAAMSTLAQRQYSTTADVVRRMVGALLNDAGIKIDPTVPPPGSRGGKNGAMEVDVAE